MKLQEIFQTNISLLTEKSKLPSWAIGEITYDFAKGGKLNLNGRIYPSELLAREVKKKAEQLRGQKIAGQLDHPDAGIYTKLDKAMHILDSVSYDPNTGLASARSYILDTDGGRNFLTLLKSGLKPGASMRGTGSVQNKVVQDDWEFDTVDFVLKPSFGDDATISSSNLIESANHLLGETEKKEEKPKVTVQDVAFEAMVAGVDPQVMVDMINKSIDEQELQSTNFSSEERQRIFAEAQRAGVDISDPEERKKVLEIYDRKILDEDEKLEAEAKLFLEKYKAEYPDSNATLESAKQMLIKEKEEKEKEEIKRLKIQSRLQENFLAGAPPITKKKE